MRKNKTWVFVLSFIPGVGHYYLGLMQRGLQFNLLFFGALAIIGFTRLEGFSLFLPVIWFYNLFDALHLADAYAREGGVQDRPFLPWEKIPLWHSFLGWVLIILGLYSFLASDLFLSWHILPSNLEIERLFIAAVLIGTGIYLLFGRRKLK